MFLKFGRYNMNTKQRLLDFFEAENKRDWISYRKYLAKDVLWTLHSDNEKTICGIDCYIMKEYEENNNTFVCESLYQSKDGDLIVTILKNNIGKRSCDIFEFKGGLIIKEYEFIID